MAIATVQDRFRFRVDGTAAQGGTPNWLAAENTSVSLGRGDRFRIRFEIQNTGTTTNGSNILTLMLSRNAGAYAAVTTATSFIKASDNSGGASADNSAISTRLLTADAGTFVNGQYDITGATTAITLAATSVTELEYSLVIDPATAVVGDTYDFRVYSGASPAALVTYTVTPRVTCVVTETQYIPSKFAGAASLTASARQLMQVTGPIGGGAGVIALVPGQFAKTTVSAQTSANVVLPNNPTTNNLVIVTFQSNSPTGTFTCKDSAGTPNTYTATSKTPFIDGADGLAVGIFYFTATATATKTITVTFPSSSSGDLFAAEFSGALTSGVFENDATATQTGVTTVNLPTYTTVNNGDLLIGAAAPTGSLTSSNTPWTNWPAGLGGNGDASEYLIQATAGAQAVAFSAGASTNTAGIIAAFKAAPGGGSGGLAGVGSLTANLAKLLGLAQFAGAGSLSVNLTQSSGVGATQWQATALFAGAGNLSISPPLSMRLASSSLFQGAGSLTNLDPQLAQWNPNDPVGYDTVSNQGGTLSYGGSGDLLWCCKSTIPMTGKIYIEHHVDAMPFTMRYGFCTAATTVGNGITSPGATSPSTAAYVGQDGKFVCADSANNGTALIPSFTVGDNIDLAVDTVARLLWARKNGGAWNASAAGGQDPVAGTGGAALTFSGPLFAIVNTEDAAQTTTNFGPASAIPVPTMIQHTASTSNVFPHLNIGSGDAYDNFKFILQHPVGAGNCLVLGLCYAHGLTPTVTDNNGNTWPGTPTVSADGGTGNFVAAIFVLPNANAGVTQINVAFGTRALPFQYTLTELNNIAITSTVNGTHATANVVGATLTCGSFTPTNNDANGGNIIWSFFAPAAYTTIAQAPTAWGVGNSGTMLDCDTAWSTRSGIPHASQYVLQTATAAINPTITATGVTTDTYNCVSVALKVGSAGTARAAGIHIDRLVHQGSPTRTTSYSDPSPNPLTLQLPASGNLRVLSLTNDHSTTCTVTDSEGQTWSQAVATTGSSFNTCFYCPNRSPNPNLTVTITGMSNFFCSYRFYDISGAAAAPVSGTAVANVLPGATTYSDSPILTPTASPGVVISWIGFNLGATVALTSPAGAILDACTYDAIMDGDCMDNADGLAHLFYTTNTAQHWNWTDTQSAQQSWSWAVAFKAA